MKKRRLNHSLIVLLIGLLLFTNLGLSVLAQENAKDPIILNFWWERTAFVDEAKESVIDAFNETHPNIKVSMNVLGGGDEYLRSVKAGLTAGKEGPDMFRIFGPSAMIPFAGAGLLLNLNKYADKYDWNEKIPSWALEIHTYKGNLYGLPLNPESLFLYYNKNKFEEYGWSVPKTYSELVALCEKIEAKGYIPFSFGTRGFTPANEWWLSVILNQWAGSENVYKVLTGTLPLTDESFKKALENFKFIWDKGWIMNKKMYEVSEDDSFARFADETALMLMSGSWGVKYMDKYVEDFKWGIAPFPSGDDIVPVSPLAIGFTVGVNVATEHPDAVAEFLNWLVEDPKRSALIAVNTWTDVWPITTSDPSPYFTDDMDERVSWMISYIYTIQKEGRIGYATWAFWPTKTQVYMYENLSNVLFGSLSIDDYLSKAQKLLVKAREEGEIPAMPKR